MNIVTRPLLFAATAAILITGCVKEKSKNLIVNPIDSTSTAFVPPVTTLITTPPSDIEITTSTVIVRWQGTKDVVGVRYKLDDEEWTEIISQNEITVSDLDEGKHTATVQAQHKNGSYEIKPPSFTFTVDAVKGQSVMFLKRKKNVARGSSFNYFIKGEEVDSLMGFTGVISFNAARIRVNSIAVGNLQKHPNLTTQTYTAIDNGNGKIRLDLALLGGTPVKGLAGTDTLFILNCTALNTAGETQVTFIRDSTKFRNINNQQIPVREYIDGKVEIR